ncbi:hypothetical protein [Candidatus Rickettsia kedanie]
MVAFLLENGADPNLQGRENFLLFRNSCFKQKCSHGS